MINKNISVWRGNQNPPTEYHIWLNSEGKLLAKIEDEWKLISGEEIPLASADNNGLLASSDFTSLKDNTTKIQSIWKGNPTLVSPSIFFSWNILNLNGTRVESSSSYNITYEKGYKANFTGNWKWVQTEGKKNPTRTDGSWGTILPSSNNESGPLSIKNITTNTTISLNLYAPKMGLMVSGSNVTPASGEDKTTASASITFKDRLYYGVVSSSIPNEAAIKALTNELVSSRAKTISNITADLYYCYAYPQSLGALTKITLDGATPVLGAFTLKTLTITNAAGLSVALYVYVSNNPGAFTNNELKFE